MQTRLREGKARTARQQMGARRFLRYSCNCGYLGKIRKTHGRKSPVQKTGQLWYQQEGWWLLWDLHRDEHRTASEVYSPFSTQVGRKITGWTRTPHSSISRRGQKATVCHWLFMCNVFLSPSQIFFFCFWKETSKRLAGAGLQSKTRNVAFNQQIISSSKFQAIK